MAKHQAVLQFSKICNTSFLMNVASSFFSAKVTQDTCKICIISKLSANKFPEYPFPVQFYCTQTLKYARQK